MKRIIGTYNRTMRWYRSLGKGKWVAWIVVVLVAVALFVLLVLPWLLSAKYRDQIASLKADAIIGDARDDIDDAKEKVGGLEKERDEALEREKKLKDKEDKVDDKIADIDAQLEKDKAKVEGQTDEEQVDFFNKRYPG